MEKENTSRETYDAFISYKHEPLDSYVAEQLHKMLEHYHIPRKIQKSSGKKKINRIFRDQEELSLSCDLNAHIQQALLHSDYLIIICSPDTKKSEWIQKEIEFFKLHHSHEHIMAVLIDGEPEESFPPAICYRQEEQLDDNEIVTVNLPVEPLAADIRGTSKKEIHRKLKHEILRLLAPMLSCTYDELRQRHREYRKKRILTVSTSSALLIAAVFSMVYYQSAIINDQHRNALTAQAKYLSKISGELLSSGDREGALKTAMALSYTENGEEQPYTPEQIYALNNALNSYRAPQELLDKYYPCKYYPKKMVKLDNSSYSTGSVNPEGTLYMNYRKTESGDAVFFMDTDLENTLWEITASELTNQSVTQFNDGRFLPGNTAVVHAGSQLFYLDVENKRILHSLEIPDYSNCVKYEAGARSVIAVYAKNKNFYVSIYNLETRTWEEDNTILFTCETPKEEWEEPFTDTSIVMDDAGDNFFLDINYAWKSIIIQYSISEHKIINKIPVDSIVYAMIPDDNCHLAILEHHVNEIADIDYFDDDGEILCDSYVSIYNIQTQQWVSRMEHRLPDGFYYGPNWYSGYFGLLFWKDARIGNYIGENYDMYKKRPAFVAWLNDYVTIIDPETGKFLMQFSYNANIIDVSQMDLEKILITLDEGYLICNNLNSIAHEYRTFSLNTIQMEADMSLYCSQTKTLIQHPYGADENTLVVLSQLSDDDYTPLDEEISENNNSYDHFDTGWESPGKTVGNDRYHIEKTASGDLYEDPIYIRIWDEQTQKWIPVNGQESIEINCTSMLDVAYAEEQPIIMIPLVDQTVQVLDLEKNETILSIPVSDSSYIQGAFYREDSLLILADSGTQTISLWDLKQRKMVSQLQYDFDFGKITTSSGPYFSISVDSYPYNHNTVFYVDESNQLYYYANIDCNILNLEKQEIMYDAGDSITGYYRFHSFHELKQKAEEIVGKDSLTEYEKSKYDLDE